LYAGGSAYAAGCQPKRVECGAVAERLERHGPNEITHEKPPTWYHQLFRAFLTPFNGVLFTVSVVSLFTDVIFAAPDDRSFKTIIVLSAMVLLSTLLRFWQEFRSNQAAEELKAMVHATTAVLRAGMTRPQETPISTLVPGDIVCLSAGDMIPADVRLLTAKDLFVSQAMLTGESIPIEKYPVPPAKAGKSGAGNAGSSRSPLELETTCFMGSNVVSGSATAVVAVTGNGSYFGAMARDIVGTRPQTSFDKGISRVSWMLIRFILVMTPLVFLINAITKGDWIESLLFAVSVAVGLTPEMLPMVVTANLAKGAVVMARRKAIVKRLNAIQNFGAMDILCTDKTGTLTQNKIILERHLDIHGKRGHSGAGIRLAQQLPPDRAEESARRCGAGIFSATRAGGKAPALPKNRRDPVRLPAPPYVGGSSQRRWPEPPGLQGRDRGSPVALHLRR
jgi:Mg2+-importing ATPase